MALQVVMLGPPASGKGTQAERLAQARGIPKISTGDMLRDAADSGSDLGRRAKALIDRGEFLGDEEMVGIIEERLAQPDTERGYVLDGFPRTVPQAQALDGLLRGEPLVIIDLAVPDAELLKRMQTRRVCSRCAAIAEPGARPETCERCGGRLTTRADDEDEQVRHHRLEVYGRESKPLLDYYRERPTFRSVDGAQTPDRVAEDVAARIDALASSAPGSGCRGPASRP